MHLSIAGDSMAGIPGMALVNLSKDTHLIKPLLDYHISSGLVRPDIFNWPARLQRKLKAFHPGAAVVTWGANDNQGVQASSGRVYEFGSGGWQKEYRKRVSDAIAILFDGGVRRIYWVGRPIMPDSIDDRKIRIINDVFRSEAAKHPGVQYIDAYKVFSGDDGFVQYLREDKGEIQQVREGESRRRLRATLAEDVGEGHPGALTRSF